MVESQGTSARSSAKGGTHEWDKFVSPEELSAMLERSKLLHLFFNLTAIQIKTFSQISLRQIQSTNMYFVSFPERMSGISGESDCNLILI